MVVDGVVDDEGRAGRFTGERSAGRWEWKMVTSGELFSLVRLLPCFTSLTFNHVGQLGRGASTKEVDLSACRHTIRILSPTALLASPQQADFSPHVSSSPLSSLLEYTSLVLVLLVISSLAPVTTLW